MMTRLLKSMVTNSLIRSIIPQLSGSSFQQSSPLVKSVMMNSVRRDVVTSESLKTQTDMVDVTFQRADGTEHKVKGKIGDNLLDVVVNNNLDLDGYGACEGTLACSTCHVIFNKEDYDNIEEKLTDEELDMLDLAYGLTETSRLGCQVCLTKKLNGVKVQIPAGVHDQRPPS